MSSKMILIQLLSVPEGVRPPTNEEVRSILSEIGLLGSGDRFRVVTAGDSPRSYDAEELRELRRQLELAEDVELLVVPVMTEVLPPAPSRGRGCGRPDCPVCGPDGPLGAENVWEVR